MRSDIQKFWNTDHKRISINRGPSSYAVEKEKLFPRNSLVCDLGGGTGSDTTYFLKKGHRVVIIDISDYALSIAAKKAKDQKLSSKLEARQLDLTEGVIPYKGSPFDIVYSRLTLHEFLKKDLRKIFRNIYKILKPGGHAFITVKSPEDKKEMGYLQKTTRKINHDVFKSDGIYKTRYSIKTLKKILSEGQIKNFQIKEVTENLIGRKDIVKSGRKSFLLNEITINK